MVHGPETKRFCITNMVLNTFIRFSGRVVRLRMKKGSNDGVRKQNQPLTISQLKRGGGG